MVAFAPYPLKENNTFFVTNKMLTHFFTLTQSLTHLHATHTLLLFFVIFNFYFLSPVFLLSTNYATRYRKERDRSPLTTALVFIFGCFISL